MKCSFVTETDIPKEIFSNTLSTKLNSQSAIILTQFLYQVVVRMVL